MDKSKSMDRLNTNDKLGRIRPRKPLKPFNGYLSAVFEPPFVDDVRNLLVVLRHDVAG